MANQWTEHEVDIVEWEDDFEDESLDDGSTIDDDADRVDASRVASALPDGRGSLILTGPGAGTTVIAAGAEMPEGLTRAPFALRTRDQALARKEPLFIAHAPHNVVGVMPRLLTSIIAATNGAMNVGTSIPVRQGTDVALASYLDQCTAASVKIADPEAYFLDSDVVRVKAPSKTALALRPYLGATVVNIADLLDIQRAAHANLLLSSGRALDPTDPQPALDAAFDEADDALALLRTGERLALNLTVPATWLMKPIPRTALFSQLVDQEQFDVWHIRVQWDGSLRALEQPTKLDLLQGYKRLAQLADDEGRTLLLPQTGVTGWLQLAFGASGYGAGPHGSGHAFKQARTGGTHSEPIERYFEPTLLHSVERTVHDALRVQPGYVMCDCPYCPALHNSTVWKHDHARLHHLHWMGRLAGTAAAMKRPQSSAIRRRVGSAITAAAAQPLAGISSPQHLAAWDQLL